MRREKHLRKDRARSEKYSKQYRRKVDVYWSPTGENFVVYVDGRWRGDMLKGGWNRQRMITLMRGAQGNRAKMEKVEKEKDQWARSEQRELDAGYRDWTEAAWGKRVGRKHFIY